MFLTPHSRPYIEGKAVIFILNESHKVGSLRNCLFIHIPHAPCPMLYAVRAQHESRAYPSIASNSLPFVSFVKAQTKKNEITAKTA